MKPDLIIKGKKTTQNKTAVLSIFIFIIPLFCIFLFHKGYLQLSTDITVFVIVFIVVWILFFFTTFFRYSIYLYNDRISLENNLDTDTVFYKDIIDCNIVDYKDIDGVSIKRIEMHSNSKSIVISNSDFQNYNEICDFIIQHDLPVLDKLPLKNRKLISTYSDYYFIPLLSIFIVIIGSIVINKYAQDKFDYNQKEKIVIKSKLASDCKFVDNSRKSSAYIEFKLKNLNEFDFIFKVDSLEKIEIDFIVKSCKKEKIILLEIPMSDYKIKIQKNKKPTFLEKHFYYYNIYTTAIKVETN